MCANKNCWLAFILLFIVCNQSYSQCTATINTFPYNEGFENNNGNWISSGTLSDWAWGTPTKTIINSAGGGSKCWVTGGLTNSFYNYGEASYLQSPVFDISSLNNPYISFKVFWESEKRFDGGSFQYSIDCGNSWVSLGNTNDVAACPASNWFNTSSTYLAGSQGWSGSKSDGSGSKQWVTAFHSLNNVKGATKIIFRFTFNAGTQQNNYDGFAIDDIFIGEAPSTSADFTYTCQGNKTVDFTGITAGCSTTNTYAWNFGDPASGNGNTDSRQNTSHTFSTAGTYTVTFTVGSSSSTSSTISKTITVLNVSASNTNVTCNAGNNGSANATASGSSNAYSYSWNTNPVQTTSSINNLTAGNYTVTVTSSTNACATSASVIVTQPSAITAIVRTTKSICGNNKGSANATVSGGTPSYQYLWSNNQTTSSINNIVAGIYSLKVTDANNCVANFNNIVIADSTVILSVNLGKDTGICPGEQLVLHAGNFASYLWQDGSTNQTYTVTITGNYWAKVKDNNGCNASDTITVTVDCSDIYFPSAFTPNNDGLNDNFGPWGNLAAVKNYSFAVYDRWGEIVFKSTDPYKKWNGKFNGRNSDLGTFVWVASYSYNGNLQQTRSGTISLLR
jgi:gliding motility-associated-like protein